MAHITNNNNGSLPSVPRRSYISTEVFNSSFYTYTTAFNGLVFNGTLGSVPSSSVTACPSGRILHETGKKLFPGANPGITDYMVSVFDPISMLTGFINPNNPNFSLMNTDRAAFLLDNVTGSNAGLSTQTARANALYTRGDVLAGGRFDLSGNAMIYGSLSTIGNAYIGGNLSTMNNVYIGRNLSTMSNVYIGRNLSTLGATYSGGNVFFGSNIYVKNNSTIGNANLSNGNISSTYKQYFVSTPYVRASSIVFLTYTHQSNAGILSTDRIVPTSTFRIVSNSSTDEGQVNWMIMNYY
jgi:hypothetical protein